MYVRYEPSPVFCVLQVPTYTFNHLSAVFLPLFQSITVQLNIYNKGKDKHAHTHTHHRCTSNIIGRGKSHSRPCNLMKYYYWFVFIVNLMFLTPQIDVLSDDSMTNIIIPQTVVGEVRHRSLPIYKRLRDLIETPSKKFYVFTNEHHRYQCPLFNMQYLITRMFLLV